MIRKVFIVTTLVGASVLNAQQSVEPRLLKGWNTIKPEDTYELVKKMVSPEFGGRFTGNPKYTAAAKWAATQFEAWGLKPIDPKHGYLQSYPAPYAIVDSAKLDVVQGTTRSTAAIPRHFMPMVFSDSGSANAGTVFVGWGIHAPDLGYDDYAGVDVKGKFVLCFRGTPDSDPKWMPHDAHRYRMKTARDQGALGLVYVMDVIVNNNSDLIKGFYQALISDETADQIFQDKGTTVALLKKQLRDSKRPSSMPLSAMFDLTVKSRYFANGIGQNVVGYVEGSDPALKSEFVVIGGHFDGVGEHLGLFFPGADDNASGSAVVMEAAEAFAKNGERPKRSVMFVLFGGEELGGCGSDYFVANLPPAAKTVAGFINFDMEGVGDKASASMSAPMLPTKDLLTKADEGLGILTGTVGETRSVGNRSGDIKPFFLKGYPIVSIRSNGTRPPFSYHLPGDSLDIVQPPIMANITRLTYRYAFYLADR
jgi:hypothetical protein